MMKNAMKSRDCNCRIIASLDGTQIHSHIWSPAVLCFILTTRVCMYPGGHINYSKLCINFIADLLHIFRLDGSLYHLAYC